MADAVRANEASRAGLLEPVGRGQPIALESCAGTGAGADSLTEDHAEHHLATGPSFTSALPSKFSMPLGASSPYAAAVTPGGTSENYASTHLTIHLSIMGLATSLVWAREATACSFCEPGTGMGNEHLAATAATSCRERPTEESIRLLTQHLGPTWRVRRSLPMVPWTQASRSSTTPPSWVKKP